MFKRSSLVLVMGLIGTSHAVAQSAPQALDRIGLWLGAYNADTRVNLSARDDSGSLETGNLDLSSFRSTLPRARAEFMMGERHGLALDYYGFERSRDFALSESFSYGGNDFAADAQARTRLAMDVGNVAYRWWFGNDSTVWGLGLGAAYYQVDIGVRAEAILSGVPVDGRASYKDDAIAPLAQLGWRHAFSDKLRAYVDVSGIKKNGGSLNGHIANASVGVEWFPWQNLGFGAEYSATRIKLDSDRDGYDANADIRLNGPSAYLRLRF